MAFYGKVDGEWQKLSNFNTYKDFSLVACDTNNEVKRIVEDGSAEAWTFTGHSGSVSDVVLDEDFNAYSLSNDGSVRKIDSNGQEVWSYATGDNFSAIDVGSDRSVFVGNGSGFLTKLPSDGSSEEWSFAAAGTINGLELGPSGYVYLTAGDVIQKVDPQGNEVWSFLGHSRVINGITVGEDGSAYTAAFGNNGTVKKISSNGDEVWTFGGFSSTVNDSALNDTTGAVYGVADGEIRKLDNNGNLLFQYGNITGEMNTAVIDDNGFLYVGDNNQNVYKLEDIGGSFNQVFQFQGHGGTIQGNDVLITT